MNQLSTGLQILPILEEKIKKDVIIIVGMIKKEEAEIKSKIAALEAELSANDTTQKGIAVAVEQLKLSEELNLPVILHCRMAHETILDILKNEDT